MSETEQTVVNSINNNINCWGFYLGNIFLSHIQQEIADRMWLRSWLDCDDAMAVEVCILHKYTYLKFKKYSDSDRILSDKSTNILKMYRPGEAAIGQSLLLCRLNALGTKMKINMQKEVYWLITITLVFKRRSYRICLNSIKLVVKDPDIHQVKHPFYHKAVTS